MKVHDVLTEASEDQLHNLAQQLDSHEMATLLAYWYLKDAQRHMQEKVRRRPSLYRKDPNDPEDFPLTCGPDDVAEIATHNVYRDFHDGDFLAKVEKTIESLKHGHGCEVD